MSLTLSNRQQSSIQRTQKRISDKLIFISCEGSVTEEEYFRRVGTIYQDIQSRIKIISIKEKILSTPPSQRTTEQQNSLNKSSPLNRYNQLKQYIEDNPQNYDIQPQKDEFWLIIDVDMHTALNRIEEFETVLKDCAEQKYHTAISNPFFEFWLMLHHLDVDDDDRKYAVTNTHSYENTSHFRDRLKEEANVEFYGKHSKHIYKHHNPNCKFPYPIDDEGAVKYTAESIHSAIGRAKKLENSYAPIHQLWTPELSSTVYRLLEMIEEYYDSTVNADT